jgi:3-oxoacyl-[acyl-carrier-protein] synthase-3
MPWLSFNNTRVAGISACVPPHVEKNENFTLLTEAERKQLIKTTGVSERRLADDATAASDLCQHAAEKLLNDLAWDRNEIDFILFLSQSPDYWLPATSIILQHKLGLPKTCMAFDINMGCSGYIYALSVVASYMSSGNVKKALILCGDKSSGTVSKSDKSTYPLFSDAGSATALIYDEHAPKMYFNLMSDGSAFKTIIIPEGGCRTPVSAESLQLKPVEKGIERNGINLIIDGGAVFDFSISLVIPTVKETLSKLNITHEQVDYFVFHQANLLINETLRKLLKIPAEKMPYSLHNFGNTSSASIPLTIVTQLNNQVKQQGNRMMLCGFGVGLSWGTANIELDNIVCPPLLEFSMMDSQH